MFEVRIDIRQMPRTHVRKGHILATVIIGIPLRGNILCECSRRGQPFPPPPHELKFKWNYMAKSEYSPIRSDSIISIEGSSQQ